MPYPLHQPINSATGAKLVDPPVPRDGVFIDVERSRADIPIVDERASVAFDPASQVAADTEVAFPWPFDPVQTKWRLRRTVRQKTAAELLEDDKTLSRAQISQGLLQLAQITITLIDKLISKGTITAADFDTQTRTMYQNLKTNVDKLR